MQRHFSTLHTFTLFFGENLPFNSQYHIFQYKKYHNGMDYLLEKINFPKIAPITNTNNTTHMPT